MVILNLDHQNSANERHNPVVTFWWPNNTVPHPHCCRPLCAPKTESGGLGNIVISDTAQQVPTYLLNTAKQSHFAVALMYRKAVDSCVVSIKSISSQKEYDSLMKSKALPHVWDERYYRK